MLAGLVPFLIFALIVLVIAYAVIYVLNMIPDVPPPAIAIARLIVGLIAFVLIITRAAALFGVAI